MSKTNNVLRLRGAEQAICASCGSIRFADRPRGKLCLHCRRADALADDLDAREFASELERDAVILAGLDAVDFDEEGW